MKTFYTLLQKNAKSKDVILPGADLYDYWKRVQNVLTDDNRILFKLYFYINNIEFTLRKIDEADYTRTRNKFKEFGKYYYNLFICPDEMDQFFSIYSKSQKHYHALLRFVNRWRIRRMKIKVECDMCLNPIDRTKTPHVVIYQANAGYVFKIADLINIINTALMHSPHFFVDSMVPRNPYTNMEFTKVILYEIYWKVRKTDFRMPILFQLYHDAEFDMERFMFENETTIKDHYIADFVKNAPVSDLVVYIHKMLKTMDKRRVLQIHKEFPKQLLVDVMRPYLKHYIYNVYSNSHTDKKFSSFYKLQNKIRAFIKYNPQFGRKLLIPRENLPFSFSMPISIPNSIGSSSLNESYLTPSLCQRYSSIFSTNYLTYDHEDDYKVVYSLSEYVSEPSRVSVPSPNPHFNETFNRELLYTEVSPLSTPPTGNIEHTTTPMGTSWTDSDNDEDDNEHIVIDDVD